MNLIIKNKKVIFMTRNRPSKNKNFMEMATLASQRSHDDQTQVGSILVSNRTGAILGTGYNGFARGADDQFLPTTRPEKYKYMIHSETNLLCNLAKHGVSTDDSTLYCTHSPCVHCMRMLYQAGITKVICKIKYTDFDTLLSMKDLGIKEEMTGEGYFLLTYGLK
jgi:dCMP deaminase